MLTYPLKHDPLRSPLEVICFCQLFRCVEDIITEEKRQGNFLVTKLLGQYLWPFAVKNQCALLRLVAGYQHLWNGCLLNEAMGKLIKVSRWR